ncbi:MAG: hypothetical protein V4697_02140 [Patescibacteria group bacterium]
MNKKLIWGIVIAIVVIVGAVILTSKKTPSNTSENTPATSTPVTTNTPVTKPVTAPVKPAPAVPAVTTNVSGNSSIVIVNPNGGDGFAIDTANINATIPVTLELKNVKGLSTYLLDAAGKVVSASTDENTDNKQTFQFQINQNKTVGTIQPGEYKLKVCDLKNTICDTSDKSFTVKTFNNEPASVKVMIPNGGESWKIGQKYSIVFAATGNIKPTQVAKITLESGGMIISTVSATSSPYLWTVPKSICRPDGACPNLIPGLYKVQVAIYEGSTLIAVDNSDMTLSITN